MYKFECDNSDLPVEGMFFPKVVFELPTETDLPSMLKAFEDFLRAAGYNFDGELDFVDDSGRTLESIDESEDDADKAEDEGGIQ